MSVALEKNFGQLVFKTTRTLNDNFVQDSNGQKYELRYDPNTGTSAIVGHKTTKSTGRARRVVTENIVLFESGPSGGKYTQKGKDLLAGGGLVSINDDGSTTTYNETSLRSRIQSDTDRAYNKIAGERNAHKKRGRGVGSPATTRRTLAATVGGPDGQSTSVNNPSVGDQPTLPTNTGAAKPDGGQSSNIKVKENNGILGDLAKSLGINTDLIEDVLFKAPTDREIEQIRRKFGASDSLITTISKYGLKYPTDALFGGENSQDYVKISQYTYKPPTKNLVFNSDPASLLTRGNQRTTPLEKLLGYVKLPMPNDISDSNNVSWGEDAINNLSAAVTSAYTSSPVKVAALAAAGSAAGGLTGIQGLGKLGAFAGMLSNIGGEGMKNIINDPNSRSLIGSAVASRILSMGGIEISPESILNRGLGVVPNSNMELLFNSPTLRSFVFNWKLAPRNAIEADQIRKIIRFFKQGMAVKTTSSTAGGASLLLGTPNIFKLKYLTRDNLQIQGLNRVKECAITGCSVNYTPEGTWAAYDDGQPVSTILTLRMQELEPIYASDYINQVEPGSKEDDFNPITLNEVGY